MNSIIPTLTSRRRPRCEPSRSQIAMVTGAWLALSAVVASSSSIVQQKLYGLPTGLAYYTQVTVGSPLYTSSSKKQFNLLIDTGSSNTAVVTADCCSATSTTLYSCAASSTCVDQGKQISVSYVTGAWQGELVQDTFSSQEIGVVPNVPFTAITDQSNFIQTGYDGIIGFAYPSIASPTKSPPEPYFETIQSAKSLPNVFSTLLCGSLQTLLIKDLEYTDTLYSGELLLGGTTGAKGEVYYKNDLVYTPLVQERWYNVLATTIKVNNQVVDVGCKAVNTPRAIVDSGTSNIAFPSSVYSAVVNTLRNQVQQIVPGIDDSFFSDSTPCCGTFCDPTNPQSQIFSLPSLTISLALDDGGSGQQISVTIPPEYIWRPLMVYSTFGVQKCRVFGISEGDQTLLGDVFMDGLFTVHDRASKRLGFGVAQSCPNGVTSTKNITVEKIAKGSLCDCVSSSDRTKNLLSSYLPFSSKPCFFWLWWMYLVLVSLILIFVSLCVMLYVCWQRRRFRRRARTQQLSRQQSDALGRNLLTPQCDDPGTPPRNSTTQPVTSTNSEAECAYAAPDPRPSNALTASTASRPSDVHIDIRRVQDRV